MAKKKKNLSYQEKIQQEAAAQKAKIARKRRNIVLTTICSCVLIAAIALAIMFWPGNSQYYAKIEILGYGTITVALDHDTAPITVDNFVKLAESGYYDGLSFHRIIEGFMMQGGAAPDEYKADTIVGEFSANGYENNISHTRGVISMARSNDYDSASSQFFIVHQDSPHLDGKYAAFGHVIEGIEVVDEICQSAEPTDGNGSIDVNKRPIIRSVTIIRKNG